MTRKALFVFIYLAFLLLLFEGGSRLALAYLHESNQLWEVDSGWRHSWVKRHKRTGKDVYYKFDIHDPTKGWVTKPNLRDMQVFGDKILNTNSKGLRGTLEHSYEKSDDVLRILLLGDSFTFGDEVSDDEIYAHYLREMLPGAEIINLGVHGYGHDQMLLMMEEEGVRYQPDIVILGFLSMDMPRNMLGFRDFAKPVYRLDDDLVLENVPVPTPEEVLRWDWLRPRSLEAISVLSHKVRKKFGRYDRDMEAITTALLARIADVAVENGALPLLVFMPAEKEINADPGHLPGESFLYLACATIEAAECFSVRPYFAAQLEQGVDLKRTGHWDADGHRTVAAAIRDYLLFKEYLPANALPQPQP